VVSVQQPKASEAQSAFTANLVAARSATPALITRANEVIANAARAVWESVMELFQLESEQVVKSLVPLKLGEDPTAAAVAYSERWQEGSEKLLNHMRTVSDLVRKCGRDLFHLYQESLREAAKPFQPRSR
jgi:Phasin protein